MMELRLSLRSSRPSEEGPCPFTSSENRRSSSGLQQIPINYVGSTGLCSHWVSVGTWQWRCWPMEVSNLHQGSEKMHGCRGGFEPQNLTFSCFLSVTSLGAWDTVWCSKWGLRSQHRLVWRRPLPFLRLVFSTLHGWFLSLRFVRKVFPSNTACH